MTLLQHLKRRSQQTACLLAACLAAPAFAQGGMPQPGERPFDNNARFGPRHFQQQLESSDQVEANNEQTRPGRGMRQGPRFEQRGERGQGFNREAMRDNRQRFNQSERQGRRQRQRQGNDQQADRMGPPWPERFEANNAQRGPRFESFDQDRPAMQRRQAMQGRMRGRIQEDTQESIQPRRQTNERSEANNAQRGPRRAHEQTSQERGERMQRGQGPNPYQNQGRFDRPERFNASNNLHFGPRFQADPRNQSDQRFDREGFQPNRQRGNQQAEYLQRGERGQGMQARQRWARNQGQNQGQYQNQHQGQRQAREQNQAPRFDAPNNRRGDRFENRDSERDNRDQRSDRRFNDRFPQGPQDEQTPFGPGRRQGWNR